VGAKCIFMQIISIWVFFREPIENCTNVNKSFQLTSIKPARSWMDRYKSQAETGSTMASRTL